MSNSPTYKIRVAGRISLEWQDWLGGLEIQPGEITTLVGRLPDNSALYGVLEHLANLNVTLLSVEQIANDCSDTEEE